MTIKPEQMTAKLLGINTRKTNHLCEFCQKILTDGTLSYKGLICCPNCFRSLKKAQKMKIATKIRLLLQTALCPNSVNGCQDGILPDVYGKMGQCRWCDEKKQVLARLPCETCNDTGVYDITLVTGEKVPVRCFHGKIKNPEPCETCCGTGKSLEYAKACPECGCAEYVNENLLGENYRECRKCGQDWWLQVKYGIGNSPCPDCQKKPVDK